MQRLIVMIVGWTLAFGLFVGTLLWWLGPQMANLAFFDTQRDQPYIVFEFVSANDAQTVEPLYQAPLAELVRSESAMVWPHFEQVHVQTGSVADEWHGLSIYQLAQAQHVVQVMTSAPYRLIQDYITRNLRLGSHDLLGQSELKQTLVVMLAQKRTSMNLDPLAAISALLVQQQTGSYNSDGRIILNTQPDILSLPDRAPGWDRLLVLDFASVDQALKWLRLPSVLTERELVNAKTQAFAIVVLQRRD